MVNRVVVKIDERTVLMDEVGVQAIVNAEIDNYTIVNVSVRLLEKAVKALKSLDIEHVDVAVGQDAPLIFGKFDKENNRIVGIAIAPRIINDDEE